MNTNLDILIEQLDEYKKRLSSTDYIHEKPKFFKIMKEFTNFLSTYPMDKLPDWFDKSDYFKDNFEFFNKNNIYFERALEAKESINILWGNKRNKESWALSFLDADYIREEYTRKWNDIRDLDMTGWKNLVMVWCGPFPETILYIYENTPIKKVIWVDYNSEAIFLAGEIIRFLGITDILLKYQDWCKYDYSDADIVYVASFVNLKKEIVNQVLKTWKKDVQILIRNNIWLNRIRFKNLNLEEIPEELEVTSIISNEWKYHTTQMIKLERKDRFE